MFANKRGFVVRLKNLCLCGSFTLFNLLIIFVSGGSMPIVSGIRALAWVKKKRRKKQEQTTLSLAGCCFTNLVLLADDGGSLVNYRAELKRAEKMLQIT